MKTGRLFDHSELPLLVTPEKETSSSALAAFIAAERDSLRKPGAVLFRGFDVATPHAFEEVARAIDPELKNDYLGTSPRDALTSHVFSASELPPYYPIPQHLEMSFLPRPPRRLMFCCLVPNGGVGGETPLADFRAVYRELAPETRERFEKLGVRNVRNYAGPKTPAAKLDPWKLKRWDEMFHTQDRKRVEEICAGHELQPTWLDGDRLRLVNVRPAVREHNGDKVWFNHAQVFHTSTAPSEYRRIARRQNKPKFHGLSAVARMALLVQRAVAGPDDRAMDCTFGDGTPIPAKDMENVRDAIWKNLVAFQWQKGDVLAIDNFAVSHGRMPYQGPRKVAVCWA